ncbi:MAG: Wzz/FepE/Etk N-terminal domain-containing protein [Parabacteroides sp.]|nr:Wzz/FepE/Etk N-terminal domain-containing protein [Parabacteroides sp.]
MNESQNVQVYDDEIELREIIMALWKRKIMIIAITLVGAIAAGILSFFILSPSYETRLNLVINIPAQYSTKYGDYTLPITNNQQYLNLITSNDVLLATIKDMAYEEATVENMRKRISIAENKDKDSNIFEVTVSAGNPEESLRLVQSLYNNFTNFIDAMTKERAVNFYINHFKVQTDRLENSLDSVKETLRRNEELLAQTPKIIETNANLEIQSPLNNSSDYVVPIETVNPNYIKIESDIISNKQSINNIENSMRKYTDYLKELDVEMSAINEYYSTGQADKLHSSVIGMVDTYVYLPSPPVAPTTKSSPHNVRNAAIGGVLGAMIGVMLALFIAYWKKESYK